MQRFVGICIGGPDDGNRLEHWASHKAYFKPMMEASLVPTRLHKLIPIQPVEIGRYEYVKGGIWLWKKC